MGKVCEGDWVAEPVLWCSWVHTGILTALCETELLAVTASSVCNCPLRDHTRSSILAKYAVEYVNTINTAPLTDLDNGTALDVTPRSFCSDDDELGPTVWSQASDAFGIRKGRWS